MSGERGFTMVELLVSIATSLVILTAILTMVQVATHNQQRIAHRVVVNQRARPVMNQLMDRLHSACVAPGIAPILAGSTSSQIQFLSKSGSSVSPTPDKRVVSLSGTTLSEQVFVSTGGQPPAWTFGASPTSTRELLTGVTPGSTGDPPAPVPLFRYYAYVGGQLSSTPLQTPLSTANAALTVHVAASFGLTSANITPDAGGPMTLSDSTTLRLEPASEDSAEVNLPCV